MAPSNGSTRGDAVAYQFPFSRALCDMAASDPIKSLRAVSLARDSLDDAEALAVTVARARAVRWEDIAAALGVSRSTVHHRYQHVDPPPTEGRLRRKRGHAVCDKVA